MDGVLFVNCEGWGIIQPEPWLADSLAQAQTLVFAARTDASPGMEFLPPVIIKGK